MQSTASNEESRPRCGNTERRQRKRRYAPLWGQKGDLSMYTVWLKHDYRGTELLHQDLEGIYELLLLASADGRPFTLEVTPENTTEAGND